MLRKKVLLLIPEMSMGGAQRSLSKLSLELAGHYELSVVVFNRLHKIEYPVGGQVLSLDVIPGPSWGLKAFAFWKRIIRLRKIKKNLGVEVSISFLEGADYVNILSKRLEKVVISIRGSKVHDENIKKNFYWLRHRILIPFMYQRADVIVTVNKGIASELIDHYGLERSKIEIISNFYDSLEIRTLASQPKPSYLSRFYQSPVIVTSGRLAPEKGLTQLVAVFAELKKNCPKLRLVMVGQGPCLTKLIDVCRDKSLSYETGKEFETLTDVFFAGNQANVFQYLEGATLYLMNSSSEGFPNGLVEAMLCGTVVASSDCPYGPREILAPELSLTSPINYPYRSQYGLLLPIIKNNNDALIWVNTLNNLLGDNKSMDSFKEKAIERAKNFEKDTVIASWRKLIEETAHIA